MRNCNTNDVHISFVSVEKGSVIDYIKGDMKDIIGLTFIDEISFIVIFKKKDALFYIKHSEDNNKDVYTSASHVKSIKFDKEINVFMYNKEGKLLYGVNKDQMFKYKNYFVEQVQFSPSIDIIKIEQINEESFIVGCNTQGAKYYQCKSSFIAKGTNK